MSETEFLYQNHNIGEMMEQSKFVPESLPYTVLANYLLKEKRDIIENVNIFNSAETTKYKHYTTDLLSTIQPPGYSPFSIPGDGACFVHTLVQNACLYYFSLDKEKCENVNLWIKTLFDLLRNNTPSLLHNVEEMEFYGYDGAEPHDILTMNSILLHAIVENIIVYMLLNWNNPKVHIINDMYKGKCGNEIPDIGHHIEMTKSNIISIDGLGRNFIMNILGFQQVVVVQLLEEVIKRDDTVENVSRNSSLELQLEEIKEDGQYKGFQITTEPFESLLSPYGIEGLKAIIFSHDSYHYEIYLSKEKGVPPVPVFPFDYN